jgi:Alr-MurF fusion protein
MSSVAGRGMAVINLDDLTAAGARPVGVAAARSFREISYDSRLTAPGDLFVALRTARGDGHDYIAAALAAGASGVLCRHLPAAAAAATVLQTDDPQALLLRWAQRRLAQVQPTVIAVIGGPGKTQTCRALAALLAQQAPTFQTRRSFNSLLGIPVALTRLRDDQRFAVLEFASAELRPLLQYFPPAVVLCLGRLNRDQQAALRLLPAATSVVIDGRSGPLPDLGRPLISFGTPSDRVYGQIDSMTAAGAQLALQVDGQPLTVTTQWLGEPALTSVLAATAAALPLGLAPQRIAAALSALAPLAGRLRPLRTTGGALLLDDSWNAGPAALHSGLQVLTALPARRRIAVIGRLDDRAEPLAADEALRAALASCDTVIAIGEVARPLYRVCPDDRLRAVETLRAAQAALPADLGPQDSLLICAGASQRLERLVAALLPADADRAELLVRQEPAWRSVRVGDPARPSWLRIDLDAITANIRTLQQAAAVPLMVVLKGDAYGHGAVLTARAAAAADAAALAVATLGEARALREAAVRMPILVLGYTPAWQLDQALALDLDVTIFDQQMIEQLAALRAAHGRSLRVHVKVDTGMGRLGLDPAAVPAFLARLQALGLPAHGLYTHFAGADEADLQSAQQQLTRFNHLLEQLTAAGLRPLLVHAANSAAILRLPQARFDMVRSGLACYGIAPDHSTLLPGMRAALSFHSEIAQLKAHPAGSPISYGGRYVTAAPSLIATIPVGYADGLRRVPAWRCVLIGGQRAAVVGRVTMDYIMVDVSHIPHVRSGDPVVLIGRQGDQELHVDEIAGWFETISYEILTGIMPRVPREKG